MPLALNRNEFLCDPVAGGANVTLKQIVARTSEEAQATRTRLGPGIVQHVISTDKIEEVGCMKQVESLVYFIRWRSIDELKTLFVD